MVENKVPIEKIKPLVKDAKYICKGCMGTAAQAEFRRYVKFAGFCFF
jgi:hypothetical protein